MIRSSNAKSGHVTRANVNQSADVSPLLYLDALQDLSPNFLDDICSTSKHCAGQPPRKRGRPRTKEIILGPKRPRGRPRKVLANTDAPGEKRRRGRPPKVKGSGGVVIEFGKHVVPAVSGTISRRSQDSQHQIAKKPAQELPSTTSCSMRDPSSAAPIQEIIPEEDPERAANTEDDDDETGEALGEEDDEPEDGDEKDDEKEPRNDDGTLQSSDKPPHVRHLPPPWLIQAFRACVKQLEVRDAQGLPPLYANASTFWVNPPSSYFSLRLDALSPSTLYHPHFFVWDPQALFKDLPCPNCKKALHRHSVISRPRRCVDISSTFWIIGFRYRCRHCCNPRTQKTGTLTWRSWDSRILAALPPDLAAEFPAKLSHHSAISLPLFDWMRSCFLNGMSTKQFSSAVRVQHLLRYEELHLQYLNFLAGQAQLHRWSERKFKSFRPFTDRSDDGFHGYIPSAQWFRDMYDGFIEEHRNDFNQHTAMLTANICAIDHSHKITKHIARVCGERVFNGLFTLTNEKGEIRVCNLVATKAHAQFEVALNRMQASLDMYGHSSPEIVYTDNLGDRPFLESVFPSLRKDVIPIEKYGHLESFLLPSHITINVRREEKAIDAAMRNIIDCVPTNEREADLVVGFDTEWNFAISDDGRCERGDIAIIQIAYGTHVYILQISDLIAHRRLPAMLCMVLQNPRIRKVGRMVGSDLRQLQELVESPTPFAGALDLANFAKERHVIPNAKCSLSDLCAVILGKRLNKNVSERKSMAWEHSALSAEQEQYAARDVYVALLVYLELSKVSAPKPLPTDLVSRTPVLLYNTDNTAIIASGHLSPNLNAKNFDGINLTSTRTLVEITDILVPAAIISTHRKQSLKSFGSMPFSLVCLRSHLRVFDPSKFHLPVQRQLESAVTPQLNISAKAACTLLASSTAETDLAASDGTGTLLQESLGANLEQADSAESQQASETSAAREIDTESQHYGQEILLDASSSSWDTTLRSRVLKDAFHVFNMLRLSATHALRKEFARALRDVLFVPDQEDRQPSRQHITNWLSIAKPPRTFEQMQATNPGWLWKRCRRIIPPPEVLSPLLDDLFLTYGPLLDAATNLPLFSKANWKTAKQIREMARQGFISDPPGTSGKGHIPDLT